MLWAFATLNIPAPRLFEAVAVEAVAQIRNFKPQDLANMAWAFAMLNIPAPRLFEVVVAEAVAQIRNFKPQDLANVAWAFAMMGIPSPRLFEAILRMVPAVFNQFEPVNLRQLHQVFLFLTLEAPQLELAPLLSDFRVEIRAAFVADEPSPSRSQRDVAAALLRVGWTHEFEHVTTDGLSLDMAQSDSKLAVEFDGPSHYLGDARSGLYSLNGPFLFKQRLLRKLGWKVLHVPYFEWYKLQSAKARDEYLTRQVADLQDGRSGCVEESILFFTEPP